MLEHKINVQVHAVYQAPPILHAFAYDCRGAPISLDVFLQSHDNSPPYTLYVEVKGLDQRAIFYANKPLLIAIRDAFTKAIEQMP